MSWFTDVFGGGGQRDAANEALGNSQTQIAQGYKETAQIQKDMLAQILKQAGISNDQINAIIGQAMNYMQGQGQGMIEQRRHEAAQQAAGQTQTNQQMMDFFNRLQDMQNQQNAPQLAAQQQMMQAVLPRATGLAAGTQTFTPTALYNTQLAEFNKAANNQMAARGLGNSSAALKSLQEGQSKLMATDQQQQYKNVMDIFNQLTNRSWSQVNPQTVNLNNPYANLPSVSEAMQVQGQNMLPLFQAQANQAGNYGQQQMQAHGNYGQNMSNLTGNTYNSIAGIAQQYGSVPQGGFMTGLTNLAGLYSTLSGLGSGASWSNPFGWGTKKASERTPTLSAAGVGRPVDTTPNMLSLRYRG